MKYRHLAIAAALAMVSATALGGCRKSNGSRQPAATAPATKPALSSAPRRRSQPPPTRLRDYRLVHVIVALCDNTNQPIAKVRAELGNGQSPHTNLYWGALYGVKTFLRRSPHWTLLGSTVARGERLEIAVFRASVAGRKVYLVAEAYDGACMAEAITDFLESAAGLRTRREFSFRDGDTEVRAEANSRADLICFVGHNGLMDTNLPDLPHRAEAPRPKAAVVLACQSQAYFARPLERAGCPPLILTTGNMAPEAYTLDAIVRAWAAGADRQTIRERAAAAYAKYQRCSLRAARGLFTTAGGG